MAGKFNLKELLNERSKELAEARNKTPAAAEEMEKAEKVYIDIYDILPSKDNFYDVEKNLEWLKRSIELVGLLQPLAVKPKGDKYEIIAGHRRRLAIMSLIEEGKERFRKVECTVKESEETDQGALIDRLAMIMANGYRDKSDWERMTEAIRTEALVKELKEKANIEGRTRDLLAEILKTTAAQIGRYKAIYNNLIPELMKEFKEGKIGVSATYEASGMSEEYQKKVIELCRRNEGVSVGDVQRLKRKEKAEEPIPGQINIDQYTDSVNSKEELPEQGPEEMSCSEKPNSSEEQEEPEEFEPQPETITSLCYSCTHYLECHEKKSTVTDCNKYIDKREKEKTPEQRYEEEQRKIDRETKKRLEEIEDEEKMKHLPSDTRRENILAFLDDLEAEHPYKVFGQPQTYDKYNEAWCDCIERVRSFIDAGEWQKV